MPRAPEAAALLFVGFAAMLAVGDDKERTTRIARVVEVVRGEEATPVADASVEAWGLPGGPVTKRTGADGTVRFDGVPRKDIVFVARSAGFLCGWHQPGRWWWTVPEEDTDPDGDGVTRMQLQLVPGSVIEGNVLSKEGSKPIAGAVVEAREVAHATDLWTLRGAPLWRATTDAKGRFRTTGHWPPSGAEGHGLVSAIVTVRAPDWAHEKTEVWPADAGKQKPLTFHLLPAGEIHGIVTGSDGTPAAGALVHAYPPGFWAFTPNQRDHRDTRETHPREMHVRADAKGAYSFPEASPGVKYFLWAELTARDPDSLIEREVVVARSAVTAGIGAGAACDLMLRRLGSLAVRVAPDAGGKSENVRVELKPPPDSRPWAYDDDEDGVVTVAEADPGPWTIEVDARGWVPQRLVANVEAGKAKTVTVRLSRGSSVTGVVVDDEGRPVPDAKLYAYNLDPENPDNYLDGYEETCTDEDGEFLLRGLREGPTDLSVVHERLRSDESTRIDAPATGVRLVLHETASVRFRLRLPAGARAPEHVRVTVTRLEGSYRGTQMQSVVQKSGDSYTIPHLMPGRVDVAVEVPGYAPFVARLKIRPGVAHEPEPFALSKGIVLRGRVVDASGNGIAGARVLAWGNEENAVLSKEGGVFEVPHLAPGPVDLAVTAKGMAMVLLTPRVVAGAPPLKIVLSPGGLVQGTLRDGHGGEPLSSIDFFPAAARDDNVSRWRAPVKDGVFSIRVPPGKYRCACRRADAERGPATFEVTEGGEVVLDLMHP